MIYGSNILTSVVADWTLENATMTEEAINLQAGGSAKQTISLNKLGKIPEQFMVSIVSSVFADPYKASIMAILQIETPAGNFLTYHMPIVDNGGGACVLELPTTALEHKACTFTFTSTVPVTITDWGLFAPKLQDVDLTEVLEKLPRLLADYNVMPLIVGYEEDVVAMICAYITTDTELTGHFTMSYFATQASTVIMRIKDNETSELYTPMMFHVSPGHGTISIPHAYLKKLKGYHNFVVTAQLISGSIRLDTRKVFFVIDGGGLAYNVNDIGSVAYDITVRKTEAESQISYIYAICIDDGICIVKKCQYQDTPGAAWIGEATLGNAIDAAIEFNGLWDLTYQPYIFNTDESPWVAILRPNNEVYVKRLDDTTTEQLLAVDAIAIAMIRGWDNTWDPGTDQGLVVGYVKSNGTVYYRAYCRQSDNSFMWEAEYQLSQFIGTAIDINLFKTNDFRIGFNVLANTGITYTYITKRNWPGMSVPPEYVTADVIGLTASITPIKYTDTEMKDEYVTTNVKFMDCLLSKTGTETYSISKSGFIDTTHMFIEYSCPIVVEEELTAYFTMSNSTNLITNVAADPDNNKRLILTVRDPLKLYIAATVNYLGGALLRAIVAPMWQPHIYTAYTVEITAMPPEANEYVTAGVLSLTAMTQRVYYSDYGDQMNHGYVTADVSSLTITATKVDNNPI